MLMGGSGVGVVTSGSGVSSGGIGMDIWCMPPPPPHPTNISNAKSTETGRNTYSFFLDTVREMFRPSRIAGPVQAPQQRLVGVAAYSPRLRELPFAGIGLLYSAEDPTQESLLIGVHHHRYTRV